MNDKKKRIRRENIRQAVLKIDKLEALATVKINDVFQSHWTVTLPNNIRVDYWPSTGKWRSGHSGSGTGDYKTFLKFVEREGNIKLSSDHDLPDWLAKQVAELRPEAKAAYIDAHRKCVSEGAFGENYGLRFRQLLDISIFGYDTEERQVSIAIHVDDPEPGVRLTYSDGSTKFEPDSTNWSRSA